MRVFGFLAALTLAACGAQPSGENASAGATGVGRVEAAAFTLEPEALVGVWSFDRSCASGDGMELRADGTASFDEWGQGTWSIGADDSVVLALTRWEPGVGPTEERVGYRLDVAAGVTDDLIGQLTRADGAEARGINAKRCPEAQ